jgi:hypothetical protein
MAAGDQDVEISEEEYAELLRLAGKRYKLICQNRFAEQSLKPFSPSPAPAPKAAAPSSPFGGFNPFAG